jgi:hypothetical protein
MPAGADQRFDIGVHDDLQQRLFAVKVQMTSLDESYRQGNLESAQTDLNQIRSLLDESISLTRNLSIDLSPAVLQGEGLSDALAWLVDSHYKVLRKNDDADDSTYDAHLTATLEAGKTYYVIFRDYNLARGWFNVSRTSASPALRCTGSGLVATVPDDCMDDGGVNGVGDTLEVYCVHKVARFCLSGEDCPWRG